MSRRGENIYKRKDGRWEGRYIKNRTADNKAQYGYVYGKTYSEVKEKLISAKAMPISNVSANKAKNISFDEVLTLWLLSVKKNVKEATYARYFHLVETHIRPELGNYAVDHITPVVIESYINELLNHGRVDGKGGLSPKTATEILTIIKTTINHAQYLGYSISITPSKINIKKKEKHIRVLSASEQLQLERVLLTNVDTVKFGILLSLYTGIRLGELCALRWDCVDLNSGVIKIKQTMQRIQNTDAAEERRTKIVFTDPKTQTSSRTIPLPASLLMLAHSFQSTPNSFVLTGSSEKYIEPRTMQNHFKRILQESGLSPVNYHALRHTFATRCVEVGFEIKTLSEILGHATVNITLNRYVHSSFELKSQNMNKLTLRQPV